jgi:Fe-S cluster assembly scaffold protein SufB
MKIINITNIENPYDLKDFEVHEDTTINFISRIYDKSFELPIKIIHRKPDLSSNITIRIALFGQSQVRIPVEIYVVKGAVNTYTNFKASVFIMSNESKADITPSLFIHEKAIRGAGHSLVIKNIKQKDTLYLQSRGIKFEKARDLIMNL